MEFIKKSVKIAAWISDIFWIFPMEQFLKPCNTNDGVNTERDVPVCGNGRIKEEIPQENAEGPDRKRQRDLSLSHGLFWGI